MLEESTSGSTAYYIREPGGSLLARLHPTDGIRYYHFDELGSTKLLTDATGSITDRYAYDAYGSLLSHDAYAGSVQQPYGYVGQLGYYTHWQCPDFGLLRHQYRRHSNTKYHGPTTCTQCTHHHSFVRKEHP